MKHYYYLVDLEQWITSPFAYIEESKLSVQAPLSIRLSYFQVRKDNWNQTLIIYIGSVTENRLSRAKDYIVSYINAYDKDDTEYQYKTNDPWYVYNRNFSRNVSFQYPEAQNQNTHHSPLGTRKSSLVDSTTPSSHMLTLMVGILVWNLCYTHVMYIGGHIFCSICLYL